MDQQQQQPSCRSATRPLRPGGGGCSYRFTNCTIALLSVAVILSSGAVLAAAAAASSSTQVVEGGEEEYQYYHAHPDAELYESVSAIPLTFELPPSVIDEPVMDRSRLLQSADDEGEEEDEEYWIADEDMYSSGDEDIDMNYDDEYGITENSNNFIPYYDDEEDFEMMMGVYHTEGGDYEMIEGGEGDDEEEESNPIVTYDNQAVSRKLRRRLDNPITTIVENEEEEAGGEDKYLIKKNGLRDDSIPIVSFIMSNY